MCAISILYGNFVFGSDFVMWKLSEYDQEIPQSQSRHREEEQRTGHLQ